MVVCILLVTCQQLLSSKLVVKSQQQSGDFWLRLDSLEPASLGMALSVDLLLLSMILGYLTVPF